MAQISVHITNRRRLFGRRFRSLRFTLPESWAEIPPQILFDVIDALIDNNKHLAKMLIIRSAIQIPAKYWKYANEFDLTMAYKALEWLELKPTDTPLIRRFTWRGQEYAMPAPKLENANCMEFVKADEFYSEYVKSSKTEWLHKLTATLIRPVTKTPAQAIIDSDAREPLNQVGQIDARAHIFADLPAVYHLVALMYFSACKDFIHETYGPYIFEQTAPEADQATDDDAAPISFGWYGILMNVAESGIFGNYEKVLATDLHDVLVYLVKTAAAQKTARKEMEKQSARARARAF